MSFELHPDCRRRLTERLAEALTAIRVEKGTFLDYHSTTVLSDLDSSLPRGEVRQRLEQNVSENPFSDFVTGTLATELLKTQQYNV